MQPAGWLVLAVGFGILVGACTADDARATPAPVPPTILRPALATPSVSPSAVAVELSSSQPSASPSALPAPSSVAIGQTYTVKSGDTLTIIAEQAYGDASQWTAIFDANRDQLSSPDRLSAGMVVRIPPAPRQ
jgi:nucleoid-associated protein YgaU